MPYQQGSQPQQNPEPQPEYMPGNPSQLDKSEQDPELENQEAEGLVKPTTETTTGMSTGTTGSKTGTTSGKKQHNETF